MLVLAVLAPLAGADCAVPRFENEAVVVPAGGKSAAGNFNGDNYSDLVSVTVEPAAFQVTIRLSDGAGGFGSAAVFSGPALSAYHTGLISISVLATDLNNDLNTDVVMATRSGYPIATRVLSTFLGNGLGSLAPRVDSAFAHVDPFDIAVADFNDDGTVDLIGVGDSIGFYAGNGDGTFDPPTTLASGGYSEAAIGDFNGDANLDVAATRQSSASVFVFRGNGAGAFSGSLGTTIPWMGAPITAGDLNADGRDDIVASSYLSGTSIAVLLADGSGFFNVGPNVTISDYPRDAFIGDFNEDGDMDVAAQFQSGLALLMGNGAGALGAAKTYGWGYYAETPAMGDWNGDGTPDFAMPDDNATVILLADGEGGLDVPATLATPSPYPNGVASGDFDGDGRSDLIVASNNNVVSVYRGDGAGGFLPRIDGVYAGYEWIGVQTADIDNDGDVDAVISDYLGNLILMKGDGTGRLALAGDLGGGSPNGTGYFAPVVLTDLDADGWVDIVRGNADATVALFYGSGSGEFEAQLNLASGASPNSIAVVDMNRDGRLDIVFTGADGVGIFLQAVSGFGSARIFSSYPLYPTSLATADFNRDAKADIAIAGNPMANSGAVEGVALFLGDGAGGLDGPGPVVPTALIATSRLLATDVNDDGDADLLVGGNFFTRLTALTGNGQGGFAASMIAVQNKVASMAAGDFNNDSIPDYVVSGENGRVTILMNSRSACATSTVLAAPAQVTATAASSTRVDVSWNAVGSATSYRILRREGSSALYTTVAVTPGTVDGMRRSYSDLTATAETAYLFRVIAMSAADVSPPSVPDLATTIIFADPVIAPGAMTIRAVHLHQARTAVNAVRRLSGLTAIAYTDGNATGVTIKSIHGRELRTVLHTARAALGLPVKAYTWPLTLGSLIRGADLTQIRDAVK